MRCLQRVQSRSFQPLVRCLQRVQVRSFQPLVRCLQRVQSMRRFQTRLQLPLILFRHFLIELFV